MTTKKKAKKPTSKNIAGKQQGGTLMRWSLNGHLGITGQVYGDKRFEDGCLIHTSRVLKVTVETVNSIYTLDLLTRPRIDERRPSATEADETRRQAQGLAASPTEQGSGAVRPA